MNSIYAQVVEQLAHGQRCVLVSHLDSGRKELMTLDDLQEAAGAYIVLASTAAATGQLKFDTSLISGPTLIEPFYPEPHLVILGGGHIAQPLSGFAARVGFAVTVIDDRPSFAHQGRFPDANRVICDSFSAGLKLVPLTPSTFVVIITRGHRYDLTCLRQVLPHDLGYLGMIGSRRRIEAIRGQLVEEGFSSQQLARLHAPIGLAIGAVTPEEIAVSILAEVIAVKRRGEAAQTCSANRLPLQWPEYDRAVLEQLSLLRGEPCALATVIASKGSVPRGVGAKMVVFYDGRTAGSIGGGCSEAEVVLAARDTIANGGYQLHHVDLTADVAEDEGMVCGGTMDVLIEQVLPDRGAGYQPSLKETIGIP